MNGVSPLQPVQVTTPLGPQNRGQPPGAVPQLGQLLKALVIEARPDNRFLLQIGDNQVLARSQVPLQKGQGLQLQVMATAPEIELKIVSDTLNRFLGKSLTLLGKNIDLQGLMQSLKTPQSLFNSLSSSTRQTLESFLNLQQQPLVRGEGGQILKQLVERIGLSFEHTLAREDSARAATTLKAALHEVLTLFRNAEEIASKAARLLTTIELFQVAQLHTDANQQLILPLPLPFLEQGYLIFERPQQDQEGEADDSPDVTRFSMHLRLTDIGNLQVDFLYGQEGLYLRFHTESSDIADFFGQFNSELQDAIIDTPLLGISFVADAQDPVQQLVKHIVPEGRSVLDTTA